VLERTHGGSAHIHQSHGRVHRRLIKLMALRAVSEVVIRRRQVDAGRPVDLLIPITDKRSTAVKLREILHDMQRDRGRGRWSQPDPEILVEGSLAGRLRTHETIEEFVDQVLERVFAKT
jgi:hypothetical protein